ncbi:hypothetical protein TNCV_1376661 [Trichonephila clavipes]|nr:hypothetical protein TNCV_1376661 [Trichonephila clavipes]
MHARHGLADMFENNWCLKDRHSGDVHSCHQVHFRIDERTVNRSSENTCSPDGHGYELVSSVRALVPQKFILEEELMHVKHVDVKSPLVGVMWKFGMGVISSGIVLVT